MTYSMMVTVNHHTQRRRVYIDGKRVSEVEFNKYDGIGCCFSESNKRIRRFHCVGVKKWWAS